MICLGMRYSFNTFNKEGLVLLNHSLDASMELFGIIPELSLCNSALQVVFDFDRALRGPIHVFDIIHAKVPLLRVEFLFYQGLGRTDLNFNI